MTELASLGWHNQLEEVAWKIKVNEGLWHIECDYIQALALLFNYLVTLGNTFWALKATEIHQ